MERLRLWINAGLCILALVSGVSIFTFLFITRSKPVQHQLSASVPAVRVSQITPVTFNEPVTGYGTVRPRRQVHVTPQVSGMLIQVHEGLAVGERIRKGETLFQIDPASYESQVGQLEASIRRMEANLAGLEEEKKGLNDRLETARQQLGLADKDYKSEQGLMETQSTRGVELDMALEKYLQRKEIVLGYESQVAVIPFKIDEAQAQLDVLKEQLEEARRNVERTKIVAPFEARVESVGAQLSQAVTAYFSIATLTDLEAFEIPTVVDPQELVWANHLILAKTLGRDLGEPPAVKVTWSGMGSKVSWEGQVKRLERHDEASRTDRVVVEVPNMEITSPDLMNHLERSIAQGMFVAVEFPAEPLKDAMIVPRHAVQENRYVYVFEPTEGQGNAQEGKLGIRQVPVLRLAGDQVVVDFSPESEDDSAGGDFAAFENELMACELRPGDQVILSQLSNPVVGMRIQKLNTNTMAGLTVQPGTAAPGCSWPSSLAFATPPAIVPLR